MMLTDPAGNAQSEITTSKEQATRLAENVQCLRAADPDQQAMRDLRMVRCNADLNWLHVKNFVFTPPPPHAGGDRTVVLGDDKRYFCAQPGKSGAGRERSNMMPEGLQRLSALAKSSEDASIRVQSPDLLQHHGTIRHAAADLARATKTKGQLC